MKEYYAYYSYGGYKDMWLGNDESHEEKSYYSPFLGSDLDSLGFSEGQLNQLREQINELKNKPLIRVDGDGDSRLANVHYLVANGGYKIAFLRLSDGRYAIIIRDINGEMKDDVGRSIPFVLYIVIDGEKDAVAIVNYLMDNLRRIDEIFGGLFAYDAALNSLSFNLSEMDRVMEEASGCVKEHFSLIAADENAMLMMVTNNLSIVDKVLRNIPVNVNRCQFFDYSLCPLGRGEFGYESFEPSVEPSGTRSRSQEPWWSSITKIFNELKNIEIKFGSIISDADREDLATIKKALRNIINRKLKG